MGQKVNPCGFRLVKNQKHLSNWYSNKLMYSEKVQKDFFIRNYANLYFKDILQISNIKIDQIETVNSPDCYIEVLINCLHPRTKDIYRKISTDIFENIKNNKLSTIKYIFYSKKILKKLILVYLKNKFLNFIRFLKNKFKNIFFIKVKFIRNIFEDSQLIAKYIGNLIQKRIPFRRVLKQTIEKVQLTKVKGIKIEISGRLNGAEIARSEWKLCGKIPLHTLQANVDYAFHFIETIDGVIGIKIWLLK